MAGSSDETPGWLIVVGILFFPVFFALAVLGAGVAALGHWLGGRMRALGHRS